MELSRLARLDRTADENGLVPAVAAGTTLELGFAFHEDRRFRVDRCVGPDEVADVEVQKLPNRDLRECQVGDDLEIGFNPQYLKRYTNLNEVIKQAVENFKREVQTGKYPDAEHTYH